MQKYLETKYNLRDPNLISVIDDLPLWSAPFGLKLLNTINFRNNINVLDIGSGFGFPIIELSQRLGKKCKLFGIEPWKEAVRRIKLKIKMLEIKNVKMIVGNAESLNFEDEFFDLIVSNNGINNVENEKQVLAEIGRVAKPGAQMVLTVNLPETMKEFYEIYENVLEEMGKLTEIDKLKQHILKKRKPLDHTLDSITRVDFQILNVFEDSFELRFKDGSAMLNHFLIKFAFLEPWKNILTKKDIEDIFKKVERKLNKSAEKNGTLNLSVPWVCINCCKIA